MFGNENTPPPCLIALRLTQIGDCYQRLWPHNVTNSVRERETALHSDRIFVKIRFSVCQQNCYSVTVIVFSSWPFHPLFSMSKLLFLQGSLWGLKQNYTVTELSDYLMLYSECQKIPASFVLKILAVLMSQAHFSSISNCNIEIIIYVVRRFTQ